MVISSAVARLFSDKAPPLPSYDEIAREADERRRAESGEMVRDDTDRLIEKFGAGKPPVAPPKPQVE